MVLLHEGSLGSQLAILTTPADISGAANMMCSCRLRVLLTLDVFPGKRTAIAAVAVLAVHANVRYILCR